MVVLDIARRQTLLAPRRFIVDLRKEAAIVADLSRRDDLDAVERGVVHQHLQILANDARRRDPNRQALAPRRSPRYSPERIAPHQSGLSRYQRTVLSKPVSKVSRGRQPSSRPILAASIA